MRNDSVIERDVVRITNSVIVEFAAVRPAVGDAGRRGMGIDDGAEKAVRELNDREVGGRRLAVKEARPKPSRSGGGDGGDSRRREPRW